MSYITPNMAITVWENPLDHFSYEELAANWLVVNNHDHSSGKGKQVPTGGLADAAVTTTKVNDTAITAAKVADGAITTVKHADASVTTAKLADGAATLAKLASNSVDAAKIVDASVGTAELADTSVTTGKLASASVTTAKLGDGQVTKAKLASSVAVLHEPPSLFYSDLYTSGPSASTNYNINGLTNIPFTVPAGGARMVAHVLFKGQFAFSGASIANLYCTLWFDGAEDVHGFSWTAQTDNGAGRHVGIYGTWIKDLAAGSHTINPRFSWSGTSSGFTTLPDTYVHYELWSV